MIVDKNGRVMRLMLGLIALACACEVAAQSEIKVLSTRADSVSGGDAVIQVRVPPGVSALDVIVLRNGVDVSSSFVATDVITLQGLVSGLNVGANVILAKTRSTGSILSKALVQNWPIYGPILSGPHQRPWICETQASGLGPPPDTGPCVAPTRYDWFYRTTAGTFVALPSLTPPFPANLAKTTTIDGTVVDYIVRVESGTIDESIYRIAIIDDPTNPIFNPWSTGGKKPGPGWNGKLYMHFTGGEGPGFRSGRNTVTAPLTVSDSIISTDDPLNLGFAVAFGTRNTFGTGANDAVSAETALMIKEHFIKNYGVPKFTIGLGPSGASSQLHLITNAYPGIFDGIVPDRTFPDAYTFVADVVDCNLLANYFNKKATVPWTISKISSVDGYPVSADNSTTCYSGWSGFAAQWQDPTKGFDSVVPVSLRYNAVTNPTGARGDIWTANVNALGISPVTGFARNGYDNTGLQYGLQALNSGAISVTEFLDLNANIGGLDFDGGFVAQRSLGDITGIANAYKSGRVNTSINMTLPVIDYRSYLDDQKNIHTRHRTFAMLERLIHANGTRDNMAVWTIPGTTPNNNPNLIRLGITVMNQWLENLAADKSTASYAAKVIAARPASANDACWDTSGRRIDEPATLAATLAGEGVCAQLYPIHADPRLVAGAPRAEDILKCQLKPVTVTDYTVSFTPAELVRLNVIFPQGVCDWTKPGVSQQPMTDSWLRFMPEAGTWTQMGHSSFGNN